MKNNLKVFLLVVFVAFASCSFTAKNADNPDKDKMLIDLITYVLEKTHFANKEFDDVFSAQVYSKFINDVDPLKRFFIVSDIEEFNAYETQIDDQIKNKDLAFFNLVHARLVERMKEAREIYTSELEKPFDFTVEESINIDYETLPFAASKEDLRKRWREQLKFSTISTYYDLQEEQKELQKKEGEQEEVKSDAQLEAEARESTLSSLEEYFDYVDDLERKDYFSVYINSIVELFDPHTNYLAPQDKDRFDVAMSGKLEGIGARLQKERDNVKIIEIISGGPAWRSDELSVGDMIMKVRQEDEQEAVSIGGMRLDNAVELIKGPKGSKVTLTVKKVDGSFEEITLTRDVVEIEETYAKSAITDKNGRTFGLIELPRFYFDMEDYKARNAASDVKEEIIRLKEQGMEGLVFDLRNNGGGSLKTAIDIAGLFIESGPVVQIASSDGEIEVLEDRDREILWDGPLVILVNELSASASEILAAAMQDYERAIVIGSKQTYGKGTVQNVVDLNRWLRNNEFGDLGALKVTTQKFYRVNGGSTQLEGVNSDVVVPNRYSFIDVGERDYNNPLPYDKIAPAAFTPWDGYIDFEETINTSKERMAESEQLKLIEKNARWIKERRDENIVSLQYSEYVASIDENKERIKEFEEISNYKTEFVFRSPEYEIPLKEEDSALAEKRERWHKNLNQDVFVEEAVHILEDLKLNNFKGSKVADIKD